jgi:hypothetical protein
LRGAERSGKYQLRQNTDYFVDSSIHKTPPLIELVEKETNLGDGAVAIRTAIGE